MKTSNTKIFATAISLLLSRSVCLSISSVPTAKAHDPPVEFTSFLLLVAAPNRPVGIGQHVKRVMRIDKPLPGATVQNDIRRHEVTH